jgi:outer membrane protein assembly factor BamB
MPHSSAPGRNTSCLAAERPSRHPRGQSRALAKWRGADTWIRGALRVQFRTRRSAINRRGAPVPLRQTTPKIALAIELNRENTAQAGSRASADASRGEVSSLTDAMLAPAMRTCLVVAVVVIAACGDNLRITATPADAVPDGAVATPDCASWRQWGNTASHAGVSCVRGQRLHTMLADTVYDPFLAQEVADAFGDLIVHYQTPLLDGDDLYMMTKQGTYTPCHVTANGPSCFEADELYRLDSQIWGEQAFRISAGGALALQWSFDSDWKPEPGTVFEPVFQPALAGALIAIPGAGGALWELDRTSGQVVRHIQPFGAIDPDTYVAGGLAVTADGTIYYSALELDHDQPFDMPAAAWLVAVAPDGSTRTAAYASLIPGAPAPTDPCFDTYDARVTPLPWPPANPDGTPQLPPSSPCGPQRPGINTTPAVGADGTIFIASRAHRNARYSYIAAIGPDLSPRWATSLRGYLRDGCGITTPIDTSLAHCRVGTPVGVERTTGMLPAPRVDDLSSSSPVALPDGGVLYGASTDYNGARGHLVKLDRSGALVGSYDFGWDSTPAVLGGPRDYQIVVKDNHYAKGPGGVELGPFFVTELDAAMNVVWKFQSTNTQSCARQVDGSVTCTADHPNGFEWCINAVAVDRDGTVYASSEDGNTYAIAADGSLRDSVFLDQALGAAYTPIALDHAGHVFALNSGHLAILGE